MYIASDEKQNKIYIEDATSSNSYFCPICNKPLIIRAQNSKLKRPHFAHKKDSQCSDLWKYDMSEWHFSWQEKFPIECREVVMENNGEKHRADIFLPDCNTVIEFQHSPISKEDFDKRNQFYSSCSHNLVWIFEATDKIKTPNGISFDPCSLPFKAIDMHERTYNWKRTQKQFGEISLFPPSWITIYLETKTENESEPILLSLKKVSPHNFTFYYTSSFVKKSNFLKQYGVITSNDIKSIIDIINDTNNYIRELSKDRRMSRPYY